MTNLNSETSILVIGIHYASLEKQIGEFCNLAGFREVTFAASVYPKGDLDKRLVDGTFGVVVANVVNVADYEILGRKPIEEAIKKGTLKGAVVLTASADNDPRWDEVRKNARVEVLALPDENYGAKLMGAIQRRGTTVRPKKEFVASQRSYFLG